MRYIEPKEHCQLIRQALKKAFPSTKFSVARRRGYSIDVKWSDSVTSDAVEKIIASFEGATFDPMIDLKSKVVQELNGEKVGFVCDFIFTERKFTFSAWQPIIAQWCADRGIGEPDYQMHDGTISPNFYGKVEKYYSLYNVDLRRYMAEMSM